MSAEIIQFPKNPNVYDRVRVSVERTLKSAPGYEHVGSDSLDEIAAWIADRIEQRIAESRKPSSGRTDP